MCLQDIPVSHSIVWAVKLAFQCVAFRLQAVWLPAQTLSQIVATLDAGFDFTALPALR